MGEFGLSGLQRLMLGQDSIHARTVGTLLDVNPSRAFRSNLRGTNLDVKNILLKIVRQGRSLPIFAAQMAHLGRVSRAENSQQDYGSRGQVSGAGSKGRFQGQVQGQEAGAGLTTKTRRHKDTEYGISVLVSSWLSLPLLPAPARCSCP